MFYYTKPNETKPTPVREPTPAREPRRLRGPARRTTPGTGRWR